MAKRTKTSQTKHDTEVKRLAQDLKAKGYDVDADIRGFPQPDTRGYRPDVVGTKGKQKKIIEVETIDSVGSARDQKQQQAFQNAANRSKNTSFERKVVKSGRGS